MNGDDIRVLQQRLTDAGCYKGPIDGHAGTAVEAAKKACPDQEPVLRIETGMHVAPIQRIDVDARCRIAATGSDDKTVRLWSLPEGRLIRTQRLPIGEGNLGKIFAVAVSPDGGVIAAGGWDAHSDQRESVYFFDAATESSVQRVGAFGNVILHLAFSPDGTKLAVALGGGQGIRVLDVASGRELMADTDFAADANSNGVTFGPDGALYVTGYDGFLRRDRPDLQRTAKVAAPGGKRPYDIAIDPSGRKLSVGYADTFAVDILDAVTLRRIAAADVRGISEGNLAPSCG
jgi:WD40 repeat protein